MVLPYPRYIHTQESGRVLVVALDICVSISKIYIYTKDSVEVLWGEGASGGGGIIVCTYLIIVIVETGGSNNYYITVLLIFLML